jgi:cell division protein FtsB
MNCPECSHEIPSSAHFCSQCGARLPSFAANYPSGSTNGHGESQHSQLDVASTESVVPLVTEAVPPRSATTTQAYPSPGETAPIAASAPPEAVPPITAAQSPAMSSPPSISLARTPGRLRLRLLSAIAASLALAIGVGGFAARDLVERRDATIAVLTSQMDQLVAANAAFQSEIQSLATERQELLAARERLTGERNDLATQRDGLVVLRDQLLGQRDGLQAERDRLAGQVADLEKRAKELGDTVAERDRQLGQARQEGSRQQTRAESAENLSGLLAQIVAVDEQIQQEFFVFFASYDDYNRAVQRGSYATAQQAYNRGMASGERLKALFSRRDTLLNKVR